jgi:glycosyltransferase involved in cell wall biosynthesis
LLYVTLHDRIVARRLIELAGKIDIVHVWPLGAEHTLKAAARLGIPTVLERCNAHTRFAYEVVRKECSRLGVSLPSDHEHAFNAKYLRREESEYRLADRLLCPSEFVVQTFVSEGFKREKLTRHIYGVDNDLFFESRRSHSHRNGLTMMFVGVCAVRKGLHFALEAWLRSAASETGTFIIAGEFLPAYRERLASMLAHPSVVVLGHRNDVPKLIRGSDLLVLPSIEEGFGLVCTEAMASGCVPLVSDACTDICKHMENALVHRVGDVASLAAHISRLHSDRELLARLRAAGLKLVPDITWNSAGVKLLATYREIISTLNRSAEMRGLAVGGREAGRG